MPPEVYRRAVLHTDTYVEGRSFNSSIFCYHNHVRQTLLEHCEKCNSYLQQKIIVTVIINNQFGDLKTSLHSRSLHLQWQNTLSLPASRRGVLCWLHYALTYLSTFQTLLFTYWNRSKAPVCHTRLTQHPDLAEELRYPVYHFTCVSPSFCYEIRLQQNMVLSMGLTGSKTWKMKSQNINSFLKSKIICFTYHCISPPLHS